MIIPTAFHAMIMTGGFDGTHPGDFAQLSGRDVHFQRAHSKCRRCWGSRGMFDDCNSTPVLFFPTPTKRETDALLHHITDIRYGSSWTPATIRQHDWPLLPWRPCKARPCCASTTGSSARWTFNPSNASATLSRRRIPRVPRLVDLVCRTSPVVCSCSFVIY